VANLVVIQILAILAVNLNRVCYLRLNVIQPHYIQISAFFTVAADFIDSGMKLPNGQPNNSPISAKNDGPSPISSVKNRLAQPLPASTAVKQTVNANSLDQLSNTWAKVKSSQPLSSEQVARVVSNASSDKPEQTLNQQVSQLIKQLASQYTNEQKAINELKLFLVKLDTQQGLLSLLSQTSYPKGNNVLISLDTKGAWQIQLPSQGFSLANLSAQFSGSQNSLQPMNLNNNADLKALFNLAQSVAGTGLPLKQTTSQTASQTMTNPLLSGAAQSTQALKASIEGLTPSLSNVPSSILVSGKSIDLNTVQTALNNSGQTFEAKLASQLESKQNINQPNMQISLDNKTSVNNAPDFTGRFKQVEQQVNQWVKQFADELKGTKTAVTQPATLNTAKVDFTQGTALNLETKSPSATNSSLSPLNSLAESDNKAWLIKNQNILISEFTKTMLNNNSFIPNWSSAGQFKNAGELNELFSILLAPKHTPNTAGQSIWPNNLSVQSQINQTLQLLLTHTPEAEKDTVQSQLMRQIFNINQSLMKMQHDQIHNRLGQQQPDTPTQFQMSIPYAHQNQVHWADMELKESHSQNEKKEKTTGWHLILRFEQNTENAFAVETQLKQNQLTVVLWATEKHQLKRLNQDIPLLKNKLNNAGFQLDAITSKHGSPNKIQKPIQQSLVDVHT